MSRNAKNASLSLDGNPTVSVVSPGTAVALDVNSNFFLGGVRKLSTVNPNAVDNDPASIQDFSGCINQLEVCKITLQSLYLWYPVPGSKILVRSYPFPRSWASYFRLACFILATSVPTIWEAGTGRSVPARLRHCANPAKEQEMALNKSVQGPLWFFPFLIPRALKRPCYFNYNNFPIKQNF